MRRIDFAPLRRPIPFLLTAALVAGLGVGCESAGEDRVLGIDATGAVVGLAYLDRDGDGSADATDGPVAGLDVGLVLRGARDTVARATTDDAGVYLFGGVAVGSYRVVVDSASVADTLEVVSIDTAEVTVAFDDTATVLINLSYPSVTVSEARTTAADRRVALNAVALNAVGAFGDASVHLVDATGAVRAVEVATAGLAAGDSVRLIGTIAARSGQPVLEDAIAFVLAESSVPEPDTLGTGAAATADGGALDAALVRIEGASVLDARSTITGDVLLVVDDGSGAAEVLLDRDAGFATAPLPGAILDATGLLVPSAETAGRWSLKPRSTDDLRYEYPTATVAEVRALPAGKRVALIGVALNGRATFGDATVHVSDATGALRTIRVGQANLFAGDSVRLLGTVAVQDGQPVLADAIASILAVGTPPAAREVATADAAAAAGGLDAALVRIVAATVGDTATTSAGDFQLTVDDGSGPLLVLIDQDTGIPRAPYVPGVVIDATGVLVPMPGGGAWMLKPRAPSDIGVQ